MRSLVRMALAPFVVALLLAMTSCGSSEADGTVKRVPAPEAVTLIAEGRHDVIDLRPPAAFAAGHVVGAVNIDASAADFEDRVAELDKSATYLVYARSKSDSSRAADRMAAIGVDHVLDAGAFGMLALAGAELES